ncbi:hypothetical protein [Candidatus Accumulibacter sp. ACC012]|uniref:hypothetical protein n=1 Tax=Candidatus Accumulibacter sp. ACC012 TaxID=2823332 RepID=UPI0025C2B0A4|nr:hypothetical protein [Candidatus Accumulibacter sp. ACC012]
MLLRDFRFVRQVDLVLSASIPAAGPEQRHASAIDNSREHGSSEIGILSFVHGRI